MKSVNFNCIKCGNPMQAPEKSERVLCAVCGTTNSPGGTFAKLKALAEKNTMAGSPGYKQREYPIDPDYTSEDDSVFGEIEERTFPEEEQKSTNKRGLGLTAIFVLMPVVIMISELLKIPPVIIMAAAAVIFALFVASKRKK
jgi:LSD1 subclass zinc finger protein